MIPFQILALFVGTALIRLLHTVRRKLTGEDKYFSFSDFLVEEQHVQVRGFVYSALPPLAGGAILGTVSTIHPIVAASAGFAAAYLGVGPVFRFPLQLLDDHLLPYWHKLKFLYVLFVGFSTALAYVGFEIAQQAIPLMVSMTRTGGWQTFLDEVAANAIYDLAKAAVVGLFVLSGLYVTRERKRIGDQIAEAKQKEWEEDMRKYQNTHGNETIQEVAGEAVGGEAVG